MSRPQVFLHIGANKTGTSTIQRFCDSQRLRLMLDGLLYPQTGRRGGAHYALSDALGFSRHKLANDVRKSRQLKLQTSLAQEVQDSGADHIVFSSENFVCDGDPADVLNFFKDYDVRIIVYLRRHDEWWLSAYNQAVRQVKQPKWKWGLEDFVEFYSARKSLYGNWRHLVDRWASVFGNERMIVRPFEKEQNQPNLLADFFRHIGHENISTEEIAPVNESLDERSLRMIDLVQRCEIGDEARQRVIQYIVDHPFGGRRYKVPANFLRDLIDRNVEDYAYIARQYLQRSDGQLFFAPLPEDTDFPASAALPDMQDAVTLVIRALAAKIDDSRFEIDSNNSS